MSDGYDHHAAAAARENAFVSSDQDGGGGSGDDGSNHLTLEGVNVTIGSNALDSPIVDGVAGKKIFKKGLNGNLMTALNGRNGDKINPFKGLQSIQVNAAAGKSIGGPGIAGVGHLPSHAMFGGKGQGHG